MTVENTIQRYKEFVNRGDDLGAKVLKEHMLKARKFKGHPFLKELVDPPTEKVEEKKKKKDSQDDSKEESKEEVKEEVEDGQKSEG